MPLSTPQFVDFNETAIGIDFTQFSDGNEEPCIVDIQFKESIRHWNVSNQKDFVAVKLFLRSPIDAIEMAMGASNVKYQQGTDAIILEVIFPKHANISPNWSTGDYPQQHAQTDALYKSLALILKQTCSKPFKMSTSITDIYAPTGSQPCSLSQLQTCNENDVPKTEALSAQKNDATCPEETVKTDVIDVDDLYAKIENDETRATEPRKKKQHSDDEYLEEQRNSKKKNKASGPKKRRRSSNVTVKGQVTKLRKRDNQTRSSLVVRDEESSSNVMLREDTAIDDTEATEGDLVADPDSSLIVDTPVIAKAKPKTSFDDLRPKTKISVGPKKVMQKKYQKDETTVNAKIASYKSNLPTEESVSKLESSVFKDNLRTAGNLSIGRNIDQ